MKELEGKRIAILGLGASGAAATRLALMNGGDVYVSDWRTEPSASARADELGSLGARVELGAHDVEWVARADTVVVSPGIPPDAPVLQRLRARGIGWVSEPEFAFRFLHGPLIAVTGTNGKTTTAALTAQLMTESGLAVGLGGNIGAGFGPPASELALSRPIPDWFVVEVSSFQLADTVSFAPSIGVITNLAPDHLDRYPSVDAYYADKARLFLNATSESRWVLNADQPEVEALAGSSPGHRYRFSLEADTGADAFLRDDVLVLRLPGGEEEALVSTGDLALLGRHNLSNALAAALTAHLAGVQGTEPLRRGLRGFHPLPHRLEFVGAAGGLRWVNDSKATNVAATVGALQSLDGPLVLLLGGKDKGEDLTPLGLALHDGVRAVVVYGQARHRLAQALVPGSEGRSTAVREVDGSFEDAVAQARELAEPGDVLLLSPACSSFDMFANYEARGRRFAALARGES